MQKKHSWTVQSAKKMANKALLSEQNAFPMRYFLGSGGGYLVYKSGLRFLFPAPDVPFLIPPKMPF